MAQTKVGSGFVATGAVGPTSLSTGAPYWDTSGNVGVGTSSPGYRLDVQQNGNLNASIGISNTTAGTSSLARFLAISDAGSAIFGFTSSSYTDITGAADALLLNANNASGGMAFALDGVVKMKMDSSGNLGIGTSSPNYQLQLYKGGAVANYLQVTSGATGTGAANGTLFGVDASGNGIVTVQGAVNYITSVAGVERMRIDSSGNVGIGASFPSTYGNLVVNFSGSSKIVARESSTGYQAILYADGGAAFSGAVSNIPYLFLTNNTERARIDTSGNLLVGTTSTDPSGANVTGVAIGGTGYISTCNSSNVGAIFARKTTTGDIVVFRYGTTQVGTINTNGTGVTYNSASDYRLKHDVAPLSNGLSTVSALKPVTYKWKSDDSYGEGFIAHELQAVIPEAVSGEKDAVNEDGSIKPQGVDYSKIVVHLVAAIQELTAKVTALEAKVGS